MDIKRVVMFVAVLGIGLFLKATPVMADQDCDGCEMECVQCILYGPNDACENNCTQCWQACPGTEAQ